MNKPERPDFEYYRTVARVVTDPEHLAGEIIDLVYEARKYIEYLEGIQAPPYEKGEK
jgi:hypothetical protein